jgi:hypothetical protein
MNISDQLDGMSHSEQQAFLRALLMRDRLQDDVDAFGEVSLVYNVETKADRARTTVREPHRVLRSRGHPGAHQEEVTTAKGVRWADNEYYSVSKSPTLSRSPVMRVAGKGGLLADPYLRGRASSLNSSAADNTSSRRRGSTGDGTSQEREPLLDRTAATLVSGGSPPVSGSGRRSMLSAGRNARSMSVESTFVGHSLNPHREEDPETTSRVLARMPIIHSQSLQNVNEFERINKSYIAGAALRVPAAMNVTSPPSSSPLVISPTSANTEIGDRLDGIHRLRRDLSLSPTAMLADYACDYDDVSTFFK